MMSDADLLLDIDRLQAAFAEKHDHRVGRFDGFGNLVAEPLAGSHIVFSHLHVCARCPGLMGEMLNPLPISAAVAEKDDARTSITCALTRGSIVHSVAGVISGL